MELMARLSVCAGTIVNSMVDILESGGVMCGAAQTVVGTNSWVIWSHW